MLEDEHAVQREKYFDFAFSPMYELNGEIISVIGIGTDCTEKVKAREKLLENEERLQQEVEQRTLDLKKTNEALARSNRDLEQYAFVTSHDLQEPLRLVGLGSVPLPLRPCQHLPGVDHRGGHFQSLPAGQVGRIPQPHGHLLVADRDGESVLGRLVAAQPGGILHNPHNPARCR